MSDDLPPDRLTTDEILDLTRTLKLLNDALDEYGFGPSVSFRDLARYARLGVEAEASADARHGVDWSGIDRCVGVPQAGPVHPGAVLKEWLEEHGMTGLALAQKIGVSSGTISHLINNKRGGKGGGPWYALSEPMALCLEHETGVRAEVWLHLQMAWTLARLRDTTRTS